MKKKPRIAVAHLLVTDQQFDMVMRALRALAPKAAPPRRQISKKPTTKPRQKSRTKAKKRRKG